MGISVCDEIFVTLNIPRRHSEPLTGEIFEGTQANSHFLGDAIGGTK